MILGGLRDKNFIRFRYIFFPIILDILPVTQQYLVVRLRIEEDNRGSEKKEAHSSNEAKANFLEHGQNSKSKKTFIKGKCSKLGPKGKVSKKQKFLGKCFNNGKQGHKSFDYRLPKRNKPKEANVVDEISKDVYDIDLTIVIS